MKEQRKHSLLKISLDNTRCEVEILKVPTNQSFTILYKFYYYAPNDDIDEFNQKIAITQLRRHLVLNLPKEIKRHIFTHTMPDIPSFILNKKLKDCYAEVELVLFTNQFIPTTKDKFLNQMITTINNSFDEFSKNNKFIKIMKKN